MGRETFSSVDYATRIGQLNDKVAQHNMHVPVEKGIAEAQWTKKKHLDRMRQYHQPDPAWLTANHEEPPEVIQRENVPEDEVGGEEKASRNDVVEHVPIKQKEEPQIRYRNKPSKAAATQEETPTNVEHVLQHHRQMHDEMTTELSRMAQQLKINSQSFGDILAKDDKVLSDAQGAVESNLERMRKERQRLDVHYAKSWGTSFMTFGIVLFVCIIFVLVFFTIKFLPKP
ncbi:hypothetical protein DFQ28_006614 [Apophysomyces sp. BC1034]|nr:hypothetical protein DFQ30_003373 [Apophysomyces sp. BC1015]KAG0183001.1 hypothetical protein DFQ29_000812 [Apophysomyces sp. BC1021]KAG0194765.1 hypothetical protein DFQ28_006614 [Apophysomyces sp. BC1034]